MKKTFFIILRVLIGIILIGKISNWFMNYSDETNKIFNVAMFTLIGIAYLVSGFFWDKKLNKIIILICGFYLIIMNFLNDFGTFKSIIGIVCLLTPMLIAKFSSKEIGKEVLTENLKK